MSKHSKNKPAYNTEAGCVTKNHGVEWLSGVAIYVPGGEAAAVKSALLARMVPEWKADQLTRLYDAHRYNGLDHESAIKRLGHLARGI